jgi:hypothetical protein
MLLLAVALRAIEPRSLTNFLWIKTSLDATMCLGFYPMEAEGTGDGRRGEAPPGASRRKKLPE